MNNKFRRKAASALAVALTVALPVTSHASLDSALNGMFASITNPGAYESQKRMGLVGGNMTLRVPNQNVNLMTLDPPRISLGCGSIDMHGGSFSFINSQQLIAVLRNIGQIAAVALFDLAIGSLSKDLQNTISKYSHVIQTLNNMKMNSCKIGSSLASDIKDAAAGKDFGTHTNQVLKNMMGNSSDNWTSYFTTLFSSNDRRPEFMQGRNPNVANLTWRALHKSQVHRGTIPGLSDDAIAHLIMNITGTKVVLTKEAAGGDLDCATTGSNYVSTLLSGGGSACEDSHANIPGGGIKPHDLYKGDPTKTVLVFSDAQDNEEGYQRLSTIPKLLTGDASSESSNALLPGGTLLMAHRVLFGRGGAAASMTPDNNLTLDQVDGGLVYYLTKGTAGDMWGNYDASKYLSFFSIPMLRHLATVQRSPDAVFQVATHMASYAAQEMAIAFMQRLADAARNAYSGTVGAAVSKTADFDKNLKEFSDLIAAERGNATESSKRQLELAVLVSKIADSLGSGAIKPPMRRSAR